MQLVLKSLTSSHGPHGLTALLNSVHYNVKVYEVRIVSALLAKIRVPYWLRGDGNLRSKIVGCWNDLLRKTCGRKR